MAHDVFISCSTHDKPTADAVCAHLESAGVRCWIAPRDIRPGTNWGESIIDAISSSAVMVLIYSGNSNRSQQVMREVERAVAKNVVIIPFRIENVPPTKAMEYFISTPHWLDAYTGPLENHFGKLAEAVRAILDVQKRLQATEPPPTPAPLTESRVARKRIAPILAQRGPAIGIFVLLALLGAGITVAMAEFSYATARRPPMHTTSDLASLVQSYTWKAAPDQNPIPLNKPLYTAADTLTFESDGYVNIVTVDQGQYTFRWELNGQTLKLVEDKTDGLTTEFHMAQSFDPDGVKLQPADKPDAAFLVTRIPRLSPWENIDRIGNRSMRYWSAFLAWVPPLVVAAVLFGPLVQHRRLRWIGLVMIGQYLLFIGVAVHWQWIAAIPYAAIIALIWIVPQVAMLCPVMRLSGASVHGRRWPLWIGGATAAFLGALHIAGALGTAGQAMWRFGVLPDNPTPVSTGLFESGRGLDLTIGRAIRITQWVVLAAATIALTPLAIKFLRRGPWERRVWMLIGVLVVISIVQFFAAQPLSGGLFSSTMADAPQALGFVIGTDLLVPLIIALVLAWRARRYRPSACANCGRNLTGMMTEACPDCGTQCDLVSAQ